MAYIKVKGEVRAVLPGHEQQGYIIALDSMPALMVRTSGPYGFKNGDKVEVELPSVIDVPAWNVERAS